MNVTIEIDAGSGFCFGVTTAIKKAEEVLAGGGTLYCLGDIVHNGMEVERLHKQGLITIDHDEFRHLHDATVLLRAHGEPPETYAIAKANNIEIIDATCPVVLALQGGYAGNILRCPLPRLLSSASAATPRSLGSWDRPISTPSSWRTSTT